MRRSTENTWDFYLQRFVEPIVNNGEETTQETEQASNEASTEEEPAEPVEVAQQEVVETETENIAASEDAVQAESEESAKEEPSEVASLVPDTETSEPVVEEDTSTTGENIRDVLIEAAEVEGDKVFIAGTGEPGMAVNIYLGEDYLGQTSIADNGAFLFEGTASLQSGKYPVRADMVNDGQTVMARAAVSLVHEPLDVVASNTSETSNQNADNEQQVASNEEQASGADEGVSTASQQAEKSEEQASENTQLVTEEDEQSTVSGDGTSTSSQETAVVEEQPATANEQATNNTQEETSTESETAIVETESASSDTSSQQSESAQVATNSQSDNSDDGTVSTETSGTNDPADAAAGEPVTEEPVTEEANSEETEPTPEIRTGSAVIIRRGDSLWRVARRNYGRGIRYTTIFEANRDQIRDPDLIYPGQVFKVPADPDDEG